MAVDRSQRAGGLYDSSLSVYSDLAFQGALVRHERPGDPSGETFLLHFYPVATPNDFRLAPLVPGRRWDDASTNLSLQVAKSGSNMLVTVTYRSGVCTFILTPASRTISSAGENASFQVATSPTCSWSATTSAPWVTLLSGASGTGNGTVNFSVAPNNTQSLRAATITVGGVNFSLTQNAGVTATLNPPSASVSAGGGTGTVQVTLAGQSPAWDVTSQATWLQPSQINPGIPVGSVSWAAAPNFGPSPRTGTLTIAGALFTVTQTGVSEPASNSGRVYTVAGLTAPQQGGTRTELRFRYPQVTHIDSSGNVYVADNNSHRVYRIDSAGRFSLVAGNGLPYSAGDGGAAVAAGIYWPHSVVPGPSGGFFTGSSGGVRFVNASGTISTFNSNASYGLARGPDGSLYLSTGNRVLRIQPSGQEAVFAGTGAAGSSGDGGQATLAQLNYPTGLAFDPQGRLYIVETSGHRIRRVGTDGTITTVAGTGEGGYSGDAGPATQAKLYYPRGVAIDPQGRLVIADTSNMRIRRVTNGVIETISGYG